MASLYTPCFVMFCVFLNGPFSHGAHKLDLSTLFTTCFLWTSLPFIIWHIHKKTLWTVLFKYLWYNVSCLDKKTLKHKSYDVTVQINDSSLCDVTAVIVRTNLRSLPQGCFKYLVEPYDYKYAFVTSIVILL